MFLLGPVMSRIPLSALSGVLIVTAWRMNEWHAIKDIFGRRYKTSIAQFFCTMLATVIFDLTIAILIGVALSMILFVIRSSYLEISVDNVDKKHTKGKNLSDSTTGVKLVYVSGQLFFGSQDKLIACLRGLTDAKTIILSIRGVPSIDQSAMGEIYSLWTEFQQKGVEILFCGLQPQVRKMFERSGLIGAMKNNCIFHHAVDAIDSLHPDRKTIHK